MTVSSANSSVRVPPVWILALAVSSANMGMALLSPAIPSLRTYFVASADTVQLVISVFLVAVGVGQLIAGTLSDRFGRRPVLLIGAATFALSGFFALFAGSIESLIVLRLFQGLGAACCMAMGRVIINDSFVGTEAGRQMATITMIQTIVPIMGFAFGGFIADSIGWQGSIAIMAISASLTFGSVFALLEETKANRAASVNFTSVAMAYLFLFRNPLFMANALNSAMIVGAFFTMGGIMPYEYGRYGLNAAEYGMYFAITSIGYMTGNNISRRVVPRFGLDRTALFGAISGAGAVSLMLAVDIANPATPIPLTVCCLMFGLANGLTVANSIVGAIKAAGPHSGSATGLVGGMQMLSGAVFGSVAIALGGDIEFANAAFVLIAMSVTSAVAAYYALDPKSRA